MSLSSARLVLFPGQAPNGIIKMINLPHPRTAQEHHYILMNDELYELSEVDDDNPHSKSNYLRPLTKSDSKPVRSLVLENSHSSTAGVILEESNIIISTKFNFTYVLISYFIKQLEKGKESKRYQSLEDLTDVLEDGIPIITQVPEPLFIKALEKICDVIDENDEKFYRFSEEKTYEFLKAKVKTLSNSFPKSIQSQIVNPMIYPVNIEESIPDDINALALTRYSIHLLSSYLHLKVESKLHSLYDFKQLDSYIEKLQDEKAKKKAAEEQIQNVNQINAQNKRSFGGKQENGSRKKAAPAKKTAPKLTKGPLDGFFTKKK